GVPTVLARRTSTGAATTHDGRWFGADSRWPEAPHHERRNGAEEQERDPERQHDYDEPDPEVCQRLPDPEERPDRVVKLGARAPALRRLGDDRHSRRLIQIGRASCRERGWMWGGE